MGFDVKNTTKMRVLDVVLPYACRGCGRIGEPLCGCCKKYNMGSLRVLDGEGGSGEGDLEGDLGKSGKFEKSESEGDFVVYAVGRREGVLKKLIVEYKYQSRRGFSRTLAELLTGAVPDELARELVEKEAIVVPLPTISRHIRERGFDHTARLAKEFAKMTGLTFAPILRRVNKTVQVGTDEETRKKQAAEAYEVDGKLAEKLMVRSSTKGLRAEKARRPVLLIDDIWTTGASMRAARQKVLEAGFTEVYGVVLAMGLRQGGEAEEETEKSEN